MKVAVFFGSRTTEHDVSIISGLTVFNELIQNNKHETIPVYITRKGTWEIGGNLGDIEAHKVGKASGKEVCVIFKDNKKLNLKELGALGKTHEIDVAFPVFHGLNGEDGSIQGVFELSQVPYASSGILGCALGMDKIAMKDILKSHGLPLVKYSSFYRDDWNEEQEKVMETVMNELKFPIFVKPANLGSSIGITRAKNTKELKNAIDIAVHYDSRIICEEGVEDLQEINCSVRGTTTRNEASLLEEPVTFEDFLTFEEKYINEGGSMHGAKGKIKIPAPMADKSLEEKIPTAAKKVFKVLNCSGAARIDFLVDRKTNNFYVNEINIIPGSLQFHLWEKSKVSFKDLLEGMIEDALERERDKEKNSFAFDSSILQKGKMKK